MGRLRDWGLVRPHGRTKGAEYRIDPSILRRTAFKGATIHSRIGPEIVIAKLRRVLKMMMVAEGLLAPQGERRGRSEITD